MVKAIPDGYHNITPYLYLSDARGAIAFYTRAFGAKELYRLDGGDGRVGHAELQIGDSRFMLADEHPAMGVRSPKTIGGSPSSLLLYVEDVDQVFQKAIDAGATVLRPIEDKFYGDRSGMITDPFGHSWAIATHKEDVPPEEMDRRIRQMMQQS